MTKEQILAKLKDIAKDKTDVDLTAITLDTELGEVEGGLGFDSLDTVEAVMEIEELFDIQIYEEEADSIKTLGQVVELIYDKLQEKSKAEVQKTVA